MELNTQVITTPPRAASTVVMLRDTAQGLEVFLLKRHGLSDVLGGAYVFPGGKVDSSDADLNHSAHLDQSANALHRALNEPDIDYATAAGLYVAALREAFEESGVLYALGSSAQLAAQASALLRLGHSFAEVLEQMTLRLHTASIVPWSRWITPKVASVTNKRFDTRFFIAAVPDGQTAAHDNHEATESVWLTPRAALVQYWAGQIELAPPQIMSLAHLSHYTRAADAIDAARAGTPALVQPEPFEEGGTRVICYPGDPRHSISQRAMPGPTRLRYANKRFEPVNGFKSLFAKEA